MEISEWIYKKKDEKMSKAFLFIKLYTGSTNKIRLTFCLSIPEKNTFL